MRILVAYASRHGATRDVAERIARRLEDGGSRVSLQEVGEVDDVATFDAAVIGSSVYFGAWSKNAADFVRHNQHALSRMPVWLFSSGSLGSMELPPPREMAEFAASITPRAHGLFAGSLDPSKLGVGEKLMTRALRAPEGDFRDWNAIDAWTEGIAEEIRAGAVA